MIDDYYAMVERYRRDKWGQWYGVYRRAAPALSLLNRAIFPIHMRLHPLCNRSARVYYGRCRWVRALGPWELM